jgi:hypothetical protein
LFNDHGELIGVPAAGYGMAPHIGFAIPMEVIKPFLADNCLLTTDDEQCKTDKAVKNKKKDEDNG